MSAEVPLSFIDVLPVEAIIFVLTEVEFEVCIEGGECNDAGVWSFMEFIFVYM